MSLNDVKVRQARAGPKGYKLADADGLHLWVAATGRKSWRCRRKAAGRETVVTLGHYPGMTLAQARGARDRLKAASAAPEPPCPTLAEAMTAWHAAQAPLWKPHHAADVLASLTREVMPALGGTRLDRITAPALLAVLREVQARGAVELAHRLRQRLAAVWTYAIAGGLALANVAAGIEGALMPVVRQGRRPAVLTLAEARDVLRAVEAIPAHPVTRLAMRLLALTAVRPGELRQGAWAEIAGDVWRIPALRMKHVQVRAADAQDHVVPLSTQAVEALAVLRRLTGRTPLLFPSWGNSRVSMSENALVYLLNRAGLGGRHVPHGWRATFSTVMNEAHPGDGPVIELMLAHAPKDRVASAYNRARFMARRRELAQAWADMLMEGAPAPEDLLNLPRK